MRTAKRDFEIVVLLVFICCALTIPGVLAGGIIIGPSSTYIGKTVFVSPLPGETAVANGTALLNALAGITTASSTEAYVLKLGPSLYDVGTNSLQMKPYVDIEGSGENVTIIQGSIVSSTAEGSGVVRGADNAEIRLLTVKNTGGGSNAVAIYNHSVSPKMTHLTVFASGASTNNYGVYNYYYASPEMNNVTVIVTGPYYNQGVYNRQSSPTMSDMTITASAGTYNASTAVLNDEASPAMTNVTATGSGGYGVRNWTAGYVTINNSVIQGDIITIENSGSGMTTRIANSQLNGGPVLGTLTCVGAYDGSFVALGSDCR